MRLPFSFTLTVLSVITLGHVIPPVDSRASYGEACGKEVRCDSRNFMACSSSSVCDCLTGDSMIYDEGSGKCVALAGERCVLTTVQGDSTWVVEVPCTTGGNCTSGFCNCLPNYYEVANGTCTPKKGHGESCAKTDMCRGDQNLICGLGNVCVCNLDLGFVLEGDKCKLIAGSSCVATSESTTECVSGASCGSSSGLVGKCVCDIDKFHISNGTCIAKGMRGDPCATELECLPTQRNTLTFLRCIEGKCQCDPNITVESQSSSDRLCLKKLGQPCSEQNCIPGATCAQGTCQCSKTGYIRSQNHTCERRRGYKEDCNWDEECIDPLKCTNKRKCMCKHGAAFSDTSQKCLVAANEKCDYHNVGNTVSCVPNAICGSFYDRKTERSGYKCQCVTGFVASSIGEGFCYVDIGGNCSSDSAGPLTDLMCLPDTLCRSGKCECMFGDHQVYDYSTESCKSYVGGPCNIKTDCFGDGSVCVGETGLKTCQCLQHYWEFNRTCHHEMPYGGPCDTSLHNGVRSCDKGGGLVCTSKGLCECPPLQEYNPRNQTCKGLVGAICRPATDNLSGFCGDKLICKPFRGPKEEVGSCKCETGYKPGTDRRCVPGVEDVSYEELSAWND